MSIYWELFSEDFVYKNKFCIDYNFSGKESRRKLYILYFQCGTACDKLCTEKKTYWERHQKDNHFTEVYLQFLFYT